MDNSQGIILTWYKRKCGKLKFLYSLLNLYHLIRYVCLGLGWGTIDDMCAKWTSNLKNKLVHKSEHCLTNLLPWVLLASSHYGQSNPHFVDEDDKFTVKEARFQRKEVRLDTWNQLQVTMVWNIFLYGGNR